MKKTLKCLIPALLLVGVAAGQTGCSNSSQVGETLVQVRDALNSEMRLLDHDMTLAAQKMSALDFGSTEARDVLKSLLAGRNYVLDVGIVDRNARLSVIEPAAYKSFEGSDISQQEQVIRLFRTLEPVLSGDFRAVEGVEAADMEYPILSADKSLRGSISVLFKPEVLLKDIISAVVKDPSYSVWAMQTDGRVIYETDSAQIGKNAFIDPMFQPFPQLIQMAKKMSSARTGTEKYQFTTPGSSQVVKKEASWVTFEMYGIEWRIILSQTLK